MDFKGQLEHTKPYAEAFWQHEMLDRPYVCVTAPLRPSDCAWSPARSFQLCMGEQYEKIVDSFLEHVEATYYGGEALPMLELTLGPDQYAGFLGGTIQASEDVGTTWVLPCVGDWETFTVKLDQSRDSYFDKLMRCYVQAAKAGRDKFLLEMLPGLQHGI